MTDSDYPHPFLGGMMPSFTVHDLDRSVNFYSDILGWEEAWRWSDDGEDSEPSHSSVKRHNVSVMFEVIPGDVEIIKSNVYIFVDGIDELYDELIGRGLDGVDPPQDAPYGMRDFTIKDPDGHIITFGQGLEYSEDEEE